ncbi:MAG: hypothetical protein EA349_13550, partial [Halomonadaceae bacterium]
GTVYGLARMAESTLADVYPNALEIQANPTPARPSAHRMVVMEEDHYHILQADGSSQTVPRQTPDAIVSRAMEDDSIRGFVTWMRYPYWEVDATEQGWRVRFYDLRYQEPGSLNEGGPDIGYAEVQVLERDLQE